MNEFADGGTFGKMFLEQQGNEQLLLYARDAALALADIREIDGRGNMTILIHHDFIAKHFLTVGDKLKISDFNVGQLLQWDTV